MISNSCIYFEHIPWLAVTWIIIYAVVMGNLRNNFGDESPYFMLGMLIIATILTVFIENMLPTCKETLERQL